MQPKRLPRDLFGDLGRALHDVVLNSNCSHTNTSQPFVAFIIISHLRPMRAAVDLEYDLRGRNVEISNDERGWCEKSFLNPDVLRERA